ncbi:Porin [Hyphomicrobium sp. 1Nfss2.1]|uniref:porin n=1 Tax=Hyphomicrobium sp. 1Nfss2.1 TaxID=3413936 RepID=UPI003C7E9882
MLTYRRSPLATLFLGALIFALPAWHATARADGSDTCCADLEARIAELEETTARKGNRKVSVTVSGWANEAIFSWDDGVERNTYIGTNAVEQSRFRFVGEAKINADWSAGYILEVGVQGHPSNQWDQENISSEHKLASNREFALNLRKSNWYFKSKKYGQAAVGLNAMATYHLLDDADPTLTRNVNDIEGAAVFLGAFKLRHNGAFIGGLRWTDALRGIANSTPGDGLRRDVVRYDTPEWHGFSAAASIGETYLGDVMANYKGDIGDYTLVVRGGYGLSNDPGTMLSAPEGTSVVGGTACISGSTTVTSKPDFHCRWGGVGSTIMHNPTGLFLYGGWGRFSASTEHAFPAGTEFISTSNMFFLQPGIERQWNSLGKTNIFGEYRRDDSGSAAGKTVSANVDTWQLGAVQKIDAADMLVYVVYQNSSGDVFGNEVTEKAKGAPAGKTSLDPFQIVVVGSKINF